MKPVRFVGDSLKRIRHLPEDAWYDAGQGGLLYVAPVGQSTRPREFPGSCFHAS